MTTFQPHEIVDVTIKGARIMPPKPGHEHILTLGYEQTQPGVFATIELTRPAAGSVAIERVAPAEWPPQSGDLWRDRTGEIHFGIRYSPDYDDKADCEGMRPDGTRIILVASGGDESCRLSSRFYRPEYVNQQCGPLTLVYRENAK